MTRRLSAWAALALLALVPQTAPADDPPKTEDGWISLFNGKDLDGWTPKFAKHDAGENYLDTFRVEDGLLKVKYDKYDKWESQFGHLFWKTPYSKYRLRVEYRFVGDQCPGGPGWALRNNGVMYHAQPVGTMRKDQEFPVSIEGQLLGGGAKGERPTANVCTPGTHVVMDGKLITQHCIESKSKTCRGDEWVTVEFEVHGYGKVIQRVDGEEVITFEKPQLDAGDADAKKRMIDGDAALSEGYLAIQAESHPTEFRKIEILPLDE